MSYLNKLAFSLNLLLRIYSQDDIFSRMYIPTEGFGPVRVLNEVQVALAFALDYNPQGQPANGVFKPYWDVQHCDQQHSVTPEIVSEFKRNYASRGVKVKVFVTIGSRGSQYPFNIVGGDIDLWVSNAAESLTSIVRTYNLDGIDVYYESINATKHDFAYAIGKLIEKLKNNGTITAASISPFAALNDYYVQLYEEYKESIDTVVYQSHNEVEPVPDPETFVKRFKTQATEKYGADKLLVGYSYIYNDWNTLLPTAYFFGSLDILGVTNPLAYSAVGSSIWFIPPEETNCTTVSADWPKWMPEAINAQQIMVS